MRSDNIMNIIEIAKSSFWSLTYKILLNDEESIVLDLSSYFRMIED
jgi:hypothetical protein